MRENFGVGIGFESVAGAEQFLFERVVVFDDAVVDDGDFAGLVKMRMGIFVRRNAVRGPARVADAEIAGGGFGFQQRARGPRQFCPFSCATSKSASSSTATPALS